MSAVVSSVKSIGSTLKDAANPFVRLVTNCTGEDNNLGVPYFQQEEVKEAAFQSEYGCESIHKALVSRLDQRSAIVQLKALFLMRALMLEGPASFNAKMCGVSGRIQHFIHLDARRGSVEEKLRDLAQAIMQAINGDSAALARSLREMGQGGGPSAQGDSPHAQKSYKTDFQLQQERDLKAFRKRKEEERKHAAAVVVTERLYESFDGTLPPAKLVQSAIDSQKKKFAPEELDSFVEASIQTGNTGEVAAQLDAALKDGKNNLTTRFKALTLIEALVGGEIADAVIYFKQKQAGLQRHLTIDRADNPTKSQMTQQLAQKILSMLQGLGMPQPTANASPLHMQQHHQQQQQQSGFGDFGQTQTTTKPRGGSVVGQAPQQFQQPQQFAGGVNAGAQRGGGGGLDDLFSNLSVKAQPKQASPAAAAAQGAGWGVPQSTVQESAWGSAGWGAAPHQQQQQPPIAAAPFVSNNSLAFNASSNSYPAVPNNSLAVAAPAPIAPAVQQSAAMSPDVMMQQMLAMQRNMQMMAQMMAQQQPQPQPQQAAPAPQTSWGGNAVAPPPIPERPPSTTPELAPSSQSLGSSFGGNPAAQAPPAHAATASSNATRESSEEPVVAASRSTSQPSTQAQQQQQLYQQQHRDPLAAGNEITFEMVQDLQRRVQETQALLMRQQNELMEVQQKFFAQQASRR